MSAVIMLAIVGMWGAVLGPMWLRRHDAMLETRSVDRFSTAMRVLSRRPASVGSRSMVLPASVVAQATGPSVTVSGRAGDRLTTATMAPPPRVRSAAGPRETGPRETGPRETGPRDGAYPVSAATYRRRRVLALLLATAVLTLLPAALMAGPWLMLNLVIDVLLVADIAQLRATARRDADVRAVLDRRARVARTAAAARAQQAGPVPVPRRAPAEPVGVAGAEAEIFDEPPAVRYEAHAMAGRATSPVASSPNSQRQAHSQRHAQEAGGVNQRVIDLTVPGAWREAAQADVVDNVVAAAMAVDHSTELDGLLDRRRVV